MPVSSRCLAVEFRLYSVLSPPSMLIRLTVLILYEVQTVRRNRRRTNGDSVPKRRDSRNLPLWTVCEHGHYGRHGPGTRARTKSIIDPVYREFSCTLTAVRTGLGTITRRSAHLQATVKVDTPRPYKLSKTVPPVVSEMPSVSRRQRLVRIG